MFRNYVKVALRNLRHNKAYATINVLGLALSMACGILIFGLIKYHVGFDKFHPDPDRIYRIVTESHRDEVNYTQSVPPPLGKVFRNDYTYAEKVARVVNVSPVITIETGKEKKKFKEKDGVTFAEPEYFEIFNFPLVQGDKKTALVEPNSAIITESIAKKYFGNENPVNKTFYIDNKFVFKITGVLKDFPQKTDFKTQIYLSYAGLKPYDSWLSADDSWGGISSQLQCFVRLRPTASVPEVEKALFGYVKKYRATSKNIHHYKLQPLDDIHFNPHYGGVIAKPVLVVLSFIGLFLLVTACVNFVNLATAQALKRSKEVGIRKVLGGFRKQIFWQFISETGIITISAALVAMVLATIALPYINQWFDMKMSVNPLSDWMLSFFIIALIVIVTFLAGSYPGLILSGFRPVVAIKGKISQQNIGGFNTRRVLIVSQFAISQVLIIGMIVIATQMRYAKEADLGFNKDAVVMVTIGNNSNLSAEHAVKDMFSKISGVKNVSLCFAAPASTDNSTTSVKYDNRSEMEVFSINIRSGDDKYLSTFDLKLAAGRNFFPSDSIRELLVNETFAKKLNLASPGQLIGKKISINGGTIAAPIVGVVKDFHDQSFHDDISAVCIVPNFNNYQYYAVKINMANMRNVLSALEKTWNDMNPDQVYEYQFLDDQLAQFYQLEDLMLKMVQVFTLIAIFIGCLGLYGLVSFMVSQKTKEIGIRKVLGGNIADILWIFGKEFSRLIFIALLIAAPAGWMLMHSWLQSFKFRISLGPWIFVLTILISITIAVIAGGYQAIRASLANPVKSLRTE